MIKDILLRTSARLELELNFVANQAIPLPDAPLINLLLVPEGADAADDLIVDRLSEFDIVITQDIPLASRVVEKQGVAIGPRGELFDDNSVHSRLASRNLMEQFRSAGQDTRGQKPISKKDIQTFANALDRTITHCKKKAKLASPDSSR